MLTVEALHCDIFEFAALPNSALASFLAIKWTWIHSTIIQRLSINPSSVIAAKQRKYSNTRPSPDGKLSASQTSLDHRRHRI